MYPELLKNLDTGKENSLEQSHYIFHLFEISSCERLRLGGAPFIRQMVVEMPLK